MLPGNIKVSQNQIESFCRRRKITEMALFGSVVRDDFRPESDIDVLVTFAADTRYSLFDLANIREELKSILGREVDLIEKAALRNPFRRHHILQNAQVIYAASGIPIRKFPGPALSDSVTFLRTNTAKY